MTTYVRGAHMVPGAPAVTALVDGETVLADVEFAEVTGYVPLPAGIHEFRAAVMDDTTIFRSRGHWARAPSRRWHFRPARTSNFPFRWCYRTRSAPYLTSQSRHRGRGGESNRNALVRLVHAAEGAPAVTVATGGGVTLFEDVEFAEVTEYVGVPADGRTLAVYPADDTEGDLITEFTTELEEDGVYTAFATTDDGLTLVVARDQLEDGE